MNNSKNNVLNYIQKEFLSLSVVEKKIAKFILDNPQKTVNYTMRKLVNEVGVSDGSIINFANRMGYDGFTSLKIGIAQCLSDHNSLIFNNVGDKDSVKDAVKKMIDNAVSSFQSTYDINESEAFDEAANLIINAKKRIEIYGVASSSMIAQDAYYRFMKIGLPAVAVTDALICPVSASMLDEDCLALAISYTGRTDDIVKTIEIAKNNNAKCICITSYASSPLSKLCDISLIVASKESEIDNEATVSRLAQLLILDSLCSYIGYKRKEITLEKRLQINDIMDDHYKRY